MACGEEEGVRRKRDKMDNLVHFTLLYDFYGELLTERQKELFESYYHENLSLREMGELYSITPQAAYDNIRRTVNMMETYELKLGILSKHKKQKQSVDKILNDLADLYTNNEEKKERLIGDISSLLD